MSWSVSAKGSKLEVLAKLASSAISHVTGKEREIADKAIALASEVVQATDDTKYNINVSLYGSACFEGDGTQSGQSLSITIGLEWKPKPSPADKELYGKV